MGVVANVIQTYDKGAGQKLLLNAVTYTWISWWTIWRHGENSRGEML